MNHWYKDLHEQYRDEYLELVVIDLHGTREQDADNYAANKIIERQASIADQRSE